MSMFKTSANYLSMIKFSHTIFALPFAIVGFFLAVHIEGNRFVWYKFLCVVLCMVFARSAAMGFNRFIDSEIDKKNARTAQREIPAGKISYSAALWFVILSSILFVFTTGFLNLLCFCLSPVALLVILGYSVTKRFTALCHFVLGLGLSLAPLGAYLAVTGHFSVLPVLFSFIVLFWTGGFDILYALQDEDFDRDNHLHSIPAKIGRVKAMILSNTAHIVTGLLVIFAGFYGQFNWLYWLGATLFIALLFYQHRLVKPNDISKVNLAFATTNGVASVVFGAFVVVSLLI